MLRIRFVTVGGESVDATISGVDCSADFNGVPAGGETAIGDATPQGDTLPSWRCQFTLQQTPQPQDLNTLTHLPAGNYAVDGSC